jgi:hypothetical protein
MARQSPPRPASIPLTPAMPLALILFSLLSGCGPQANGGQPGQSPTDTPPPSTAAPTDTPPPSASTPASYPKLGHAPDYSWIAGQVLFTRIQSGCVYVRTDEAADLPTPDPNQPTGVTGPIVGTAVKGDTSPPLSEITPILPGSTVPQGAPGVYVPGGTGWNESQVSDGDYIVLFGHVIRPGEPYEICPGGTPYIVDSMQINN